MVDTWGLNPNDITREYESYSLGTKMGHGRFTKADTANYDDWNELFCDPIRMSDQLRLEDGTRRLLGDVCHILPYPYIYIYTPNIYKHIQHTHTYIYISDSY